MWVTNPGAVTDLCLVSFLDCAFFLTSGPSDTLPRFVGSSHLLAIRVLPTQLNRAGCGGARPLGKGTRTAGVFRWVSIFSMTTVS